MDSERQESSKCPSWRCCQVQIKAIFSDEQIQEKSPEGLLIRKTLTFSYLHESLLRTKLSYLPYSN